MVKTLIHKQSEGILQVSGKTLKKVSKSKVPTVEEMAIIKTKVYNSCEKKRKNLSWAKCPKFIMDPLINRIMNMMNASPEDHFVDAGCGIGNVMAHVATRFGCHCTGIELVGCNLDVAIEAESKFAAYRNEYNLTKPKVDYIKGDLRQQLPLLCDTIDILWCTNLLFSLEVDVFLLGQLYRLKPGCRIFLMKDLVVDRHNTGSNRYFEKTKFQWGSGDVEWTNEPGNLFMYIRTDIPYHS